PGGGRGGDRHSRLPADDESAKRNEIVPGVTDQSGGIERVLACGHPPLCLLLGPRPPAARLDTVGGVRDIGVAVAAVRAPLGELPTNIAPVGERIGDGECLLACTEVAAD